MKDQQVGHYTILEKLGSGGMGEVWLAEDSQLKRRVAVKLLSGDTTSAEARERFLREARAASALEQANICTIHEMGETEDGRVYIVMAYCEGETVQQRIARGPLDCLEAVEITIQIARGLTRAHELGIVHRDIKPANVIVGPDGVVKIVDFGLASMTDATQLTLTGGAMGTVAYMSPEQVRGEQVDHRTDLWSLGVVLFEILTAERPFPGENHASVLHKILTAYPELPEAKQADLPRELTTLVFDLLQKDNSKRTQSAAEAVEVLEGIRALLVYGPPPATSFERIIQWLRKPAVALPAGLVLALAAFGSGRAVYRGVMTQHAQDVLVPRMESQLDSLHLGAALSLLDRARRFLPDNPDLAVAEATITARATILTEPAGARILIKDYFTPNAEWHELGYSPVDSVRVPWSLQRIRAELQGYDPYETAEWFGGRQPMAKGSGGSHTNVMFRLEPHGELPEGMVRVPSGNLIGPLGRTFSAITSHTIPDYLIDRYEVTNLEFKEFVDNEGYIRREYWPDSFIRDEETVSFEMAMASFIDQNGRPGPSNWSGGTFRSGTEDHPVTGISLFEAEAYAKYAGKTLPTIFHWARALNSRAEALTSMHNYNETGSLANLGGEGVWSVRASTALTANGLYDMIGNVREWCITPNPAGMSYCMGASYLDPPYNSLNPIPFSPWNRSQYIGFRCVDYLDLQEAELDVWTDPVAYPQRSVPVHENVSDEIFESIRESYEYTPGNLDAVSIYRKEEESPYWITEKIEFNAAYNNERIPAYLMLPKNTTPPFHTVIYSPGSNSQVDPQSEGNLYYYMFNHYLMQGRAVMYPVYKGTYDRPREYGGPDTPEYREYMKQYFQDLARSIDYLETRDDIIDSTFVFCGISAAAGLAVIHLALEPRLKGGILLDGGILSRSRVSPYVSQHVFAPRVTQPVLMINGIYDPFFPYDESQLPLFELLGTTDGEKEHFPVETAHGSMIVRELVVGKIRTWLNTYQGIVR